MKNLDKDFPIDRASVRRVLAQARIAAGIKPNKQTLVSARRSGFVRGFAAGVRTALAMACQAAAKDAAHE